MQTFQELVLRLSEFWAGQGCVLQQPYDLEVGAGTMHPETFLRVLGPEPWRVAYVQPSRRPADGRYGENPFRLGKHYQMQVVLKPSPADVQQLYVQSLACACVVLEAITPGLRENIRTRGREAVARLEALKAELGGLITKVQGTGLLFSCELAPQFKCYGAGSTEEWLREHGIGVIHGGANSLRFTPRFETTADELELLVSMVGKALREGPRQTAAQAA